MYARRARTALTDSCPLLICLLPSYLPPGTISAPPSPALPPGADAAGDLLSSPARSARCTASARMHPLMSPMSIAGTEVTVKATVAHARRQSRLSSYDRVANSFTGCSSGVMMAVGRMSGNTPHPTSAPSTAFGKNPRSTPPPLTRKAMIMAPVTPCASRVLAPEVLPNAARLMTPDTGIPPTAALARLDTPCAMSSLLLSHTSPSSSAHRLHTAAPSRYVVMPMAIPGTISALAISLESDRAGGAARCPRSSEMAPTVVPASKPMKTAAPLTRQHSSAEGNILWILVPLSMTMKVHAANSAVPGCHTAGCDMSHIAAVAKCADMGPTHFAPSMAGVWEENTIHTAATTKPSSAALGRLVTRLPSLANPTTSRVTPV
mmetsp:Transcript_24997/g.62426  ORF Transcript_24997/g.62426 Transcript_24997/m.62426 type:complete len:377 (+) Transcript_24997:312-1442(+)